jgi:hypothetical protein
MQYEEGLVANFFFQNNFNNFLKHVYIYPEFFRIFDAVLTKLLEFPFVYIPDGLFVSHTSNFPCTAATGIHDQPA